MDYANETERRLGKTVEEFFATFHPQSVSRESLFNDSSLLADEEAAELVSAVCKEFQIGEDRFYEVFPFPHLFEVETSPFMLPVTLLKSILGRGKNALIHREYTIIEFARLMDKNLL